MTSPCTHIPPHPPIAYQSTPGGTLRCAACSPPPTKPHRIGILSEGRLLSSQAISADIKALPVMIENEPAFRLARAFPEMHIESIERPDGSVIKFPKIGD